MLGFATIRKDGFPNESLDRDRWRSLIGEFPELRRIESLRVGSQHYPVPDSADCLEKGEVVGSFIWESGQIYVDGPASMFPLAKGIAEILDARVFDDVGDEMLEPPEELNLPVEDQQVRHHEYPEPLDMFGKDLVSRLDCAKSDLVPLVGCLLTKGEMQLSSFPAKAIVTMTGELADEVHEWPNATLGKKFWHLVLLFRNDRLVGMKWSHQDLPKVSSASRKPWWKLW